MIMATMSPTKTVSRIVAVLGDHIASLDDDLQAKLSQVLISLKRKNIKSATSVLDSILIKLRAGSPNLYQEAMAEGFTTKYSLGFYLKVFAALSTLLSRIIWVFEFR